MQLSRARFVHHFHITFQVQCLRRWPRRGPPPEHIAGCFVDWILAASGSLSRDKEACTAILHGVAEDLVLVTTSGARPDAEIATGLIYDALAAAGVEVTIRPPAGLHSTSCAPPGHGPDAGQR